MVSMISRLGVSALLAAVSLACVSSAMAQQQSPDPLLPNADKLRPWEKRLDKFYSRGNPQTETDKTTKKLYDDPMRRLGLPENKPILPYPEAKPQAPAPTLQPGVAELDRDNNGSITREEYFRSRTPVMTPNDRVSSRGRRMIKRLDSQFRNADRNRDGIVTAEELQEDRNSRF